MLTDIAVKNARFNEPDKKQPGAMLPNKRSDSGGLHLLLTDTGSKLWRIAYRFPKGGKQKTLAIGVYPTVTLAEARGQRDAAKVLLAKGIDPSTHKKEIACERNGKMCFADLAEEWFEKNIKKDAYPSGQCHACDCRGM
jgi:hypothetical protein